MATAPSPATADRSRAARAYGYGLAGVLGLFILGGMTGVLLAPFSRGEALPGENRRLGALPTLPRDSSEWSDFPRRLEAFVNDRFGFRGALIRTGTRLSTALLNRLATNQVVAGRDGWLFYAGEGSLGLFQRTVELDPDRLDAWRRELAERARGLRDLGIGYAFVVAPDKHTVYGEFMPDYLHQGRNPSPHDQLMAVARAHDLPVVDLRAALAAAKASAPLYFRDDTHWNLRGAYIGYRTLMARLGGRHAERAIDLGNGDFDMRPHGPGDLARMAQLDQADRAPSIRDGALPCAFEEVERRKDANGAIELTRTRCATVPGKLLLFRDSFGDALLPYLAASFGEVVAVAGRPSTEEILRTAAAERPDIVVEERVERLLRFPPAARTP